jgi:branched-chain amino acid transport system permease protein
MSERSTFAPRRVVKPRWLVLLIAGALTGCLPLFLSSYGVHLASSVMAYSIAVLGLDLATGRAGLLSFGQAAFLAVGAYGSVIAMTDLNLPYFLGVALAVLAGSVLGALLAIPASRLSGLSFAFVTFGLGFVVTALLNGQLLNRWTNGAAGIVPPEVNVLGGSLQFGSTLFYVILALLMLALILYLNLVGSRTGRALSTIKENEPVAVALGINVVRYKIWAFAAGAGFATLSGALLAQTTAYVSPDSYTAQVSITLMAMLILGGMRSAVGAIIGAAFFVLLPEYLQGVDANSAIVFSAILLVTLIVAPNGVAGIARTLWARRNRSPRIKASPPSASDTRPMAVAERP